MRRPISPRDTLLRWVGLILKGLFITLFVSTVLVIVAGTFGFGSPALGLYQIVVGICWRLLVTQLAIIAVISLLEGLS